MHTIHYYITDKNYSKLKETPEDGNCYGSFYCGALCFDAVVRDYPKDAFNKDIIKDGKVLDLDCYILGIDDGYGYLDDDTPYSFYEDCGTSVSIPDIDEGRPEFITRCIKEIKAFINSSSYLKEILEYKAPHWINHEKEVNGYEEA